MRRKADGDVLDQENTLTRRIALALLGGTAGLSFWAMIQIANGELLSPRLYLGLAVFLGWFFGITLGTAGPLTLRRALLAGLLVAVPVAILVTTASLRFSDPADFIPSLPVILALLLLFVLPAPFLITGLGQGRWLNYALLFDAAWNTVVRVVAAVLFHSVFWALLFLSDLLLGIVDLSFLESLIEIESATFILSGLVGGLGIAVAGELSTYISPSLILRLLRLLLPVVTVVSAVFAAALPFRGLSGLFGNLSAAGTLMGMAVAGITLVSVTLDRDAEQEARSPALRLAAQVMSVVLAVLGVLASYAVWIRVAQYGVTPARLAGLSGALIIALYGLGYALSVMLRGDWAARVRSINVTMALIVMAVASAWFTPLIDPQRLSVASQLARFERGQTSVEDLDLWTITRTWGHAGEDALAVLSDAAHPRAGELAERLAFLAAAQSEYQFNQSVPAATAENDIAELAALLSVRGQLENLPDGFLESAGNQRIKFWASGCEYETPAGNPGCVAVVDDFLPGAPGLETVMIVMPVSNALTVNVFGAAGAKFRELRQHFDHTNGAMRLEPALIDDILENGFTVAPAGLNALRLESLDILVLP